MRPRHLASLRVAAFTFSRRAIGLRAARERDLSAASGAQWPVERFPDLGLVLQIIKQARRSILVVGQHERRSAEQRHPPILALPRLSGFGEPVSEGLDMPPDRLRDLLTRASANA